MAGTLAGCSTVLFTRTPGSRSYTEPIYEVSRPYFFWGLVGGPHDVYVSKICLGKDADQISTEYTAGNVFAGVVTLGLYTPRTVKVWCQL